MASIAGVPRSSSPAPEGRPAADAKGPTSEFHPAPPSETVEPTTVTTPPQQAATQPDSGGHVTQTVVLQPARKASFSQKVVGYAKEIRGTILHNPEMKDYGGKIRKGEEPWPPQSHHGDAQEAGHDPTSPTEQAQPASP